MNGLWFTAILFGMIYGLRSIASPGSATRTGMTYLLSCLVVTPISLIAAMFIVESKMISIHEDYVLGIVIGIVIFGSAYITDDIESH